MDIPQDVRLVAADLMLEIQRNVQEFEGWEWPITVRLVAKAILAERERCAGVAFDMLAGHKPAGIDVPTATEVAAAIRQSESLRRPS